MIFKDLLVIDCASYIAGPAAATMLSDYGARVIKVEPPGEGDSYRKLITLLPGEANENFYWVLDSRNKESLALDLKRPEAREALARLIRRADVFITNFPGPIRERLGITARDLTGLNPRLIYASLTPYGEVGPEKDRTAYDTTAWWGRSGLMDMVRPGPEAEHATTTPGMGDHPTAVSLFAGIVTALYRRQMTGEGGMVSTSLLANGLWSNSAYIQAALCGVEVPPRKPRGQRNPIQEVYTTRDGRQFVLVSVNFEREFPLLLTAIERAEWALDPRFATPDARLAHAGLMVGLLEDIFARRDWPDWRDRFTEAGVTFGLIGRTRDHEHDEQILANDFLPAFSDRPHLRTVANPVQVSGLEKVTPRMAPDVGAHSRSILTELGLSEEDILAILGRGAGLP
jgi:formyl-CoA transferase